MYMKQGSQTQREMNMGKEIENKKEQGGIERDESESNRREREEATDRKID